MPPEPGPGAWLALAAASGLVSLDDTGWPQAMVSRPFVAATLGGWLSGDPGTGLAVGAIVELFLLPYHPLGGARCPDPGPASLVAGAAAAAGGPTLPALLPAALLGWVLSWAGEVTVRWHRRFAARLFGDAAARVREAKSVERRQLASAAADFLRGALLGAVWWVPATLAVRVGTGIVPESPDTPLLLAAAALGAAGAAVAGASASRRTSRIAAPAGAVLAAATLWLLA